MEYGYQGPDPGLKIQYLLNGIRCDKLSKAVSAVRAHSDQYKKILMLQSPYSVSTSIREHQHQVCKLFLSTRPDLPSSKRLALPMALSKERLS